MKVLVILPAFNEEKSVGLVVKKIIEMTPYDVLVVNDCSEDGTAEAAKMEGAIVLSHPVNMGYGVSIQTGYKYALKNSYDYLVQMDSDGQHETKSIFTLLGTVESGECDLAIGSRFLGGGDYSMEPLRKIGQCLFGGIASKISKKEFSDPTSGFQAMNRKVIKFFSSDIFPCDYPDADVIIMAHFAGVRIEEVPVVMYRNKTGKSIHSGMKPVYYVFKMFLAIFIILLKDKSSFQKKFNQN